MHSLAPTSSLKLEPSDVFLSEDYLIVIRSSQYYMEVYQLDKDASSDRSSIKSRLGVTLKKQNKVKTFFFVLPESETEKKIPISLEYKISLGWELYPLKGLNDGNLFKEFSAEEPLVEKAPQEQVFEDAGIVSAKLPVQPLQTEPQRMPTKEANVFFDEGITIVSDSSLRKLNEPSVNGKVEHTEPNQKEPKDKDTLLEESEEDEEVNNKKEEQSRGKAAPAKEQQSQAPVIKVAVADTTKTAKLPEARTELKLETDVVIGDAKLAKITVESNKKESTDVHQSKPDLNS